MIVFDANIEFMEVGDRGGYIQAEAGSGRARAREAATEAIENQQALARGDAVAGVANANHRASRHERGENTNGSALGGEFNRVVDEVRERFPHEVGVSGAGGVASSVIEIDLARANGS